MHYNSNNWENLSTIPNHLNPPQIRRPSLYRGRRSRQIRQSWCRSSAPSCSRFEKIGLLLRTQWGAEIEGLQTLAWAGITGAAHPDEIQALRLQLKESIQSCENRLPPPTSSPTKNGVSCLLGKMAEKTMEEHLNEIFPTGEIENYSGKSICTDFCVKQHAKPDVLLELKNWTSKASKGDIKKFERDCLEQQAHGVIVSLPVNTGFVGKRNFKEDSYQQIQSPVSCQ